MNTRASMIASALLLLPGVGVPRAGFAAAADPSMHVEGSGPVTVVFESGLGDDREVWRPVQAAIAARCATTVSYTRDGYGGGRKAAAGMRDAEHIVAELRARLVASGYPPPYLLVGHSLGGLYVQYFARRHPAEVRGLVLVDSMHPQQPDRVAAEMPGVQRTIDLLTRLRGGIMRREFVGAPSTGAQVGALPAPAQLATVVLSSTQPGPGESAAFRQLLAQLQDQLAVDYAARRHEFVQGSGHYIQRERPQVVIAAVRELAGCGMERAAADATRGAHVAAR